MSRLSNIFKLLSQMLETPKPPPLTSSSNDLESPTPEQLPFSDTDSSDDNDESQHLLLDQSQPAVKSCTDDISTWTSMEQQQRPVTKKQKKSVRFTDREQGGQLIVSQQDCGERKRMIMCMMLAFYSIHQVNLDVQTIVPTHVSHFHKSLTEIHVSFIMIAFEIGGLIFSPISGALLERVGRKRAIFVGYLAIILGQIGVAMTAYLQNDMAFLYANIACRFLKGIGDVWIHTSCFSIIALKFPENRERYLGLGEAASGIGLMAGPAVGGFLYASFGFQWAFLSLAGFLIVSGCLCYYILPSSVDTVSDLQEEDASELPVKEEKISYSMFLKDRRTIMGLLTCTFVSLLMQFCSSFLVTALEHEKKVPIKYNGLIASLGALSYLTTTLLTGSIIHHFSKRVFLQLSLCGCVAALFLMGPSTLLHLPDYLWIFLIGYSLLNCFQGFLFIPILPEILESFTQTHPHLNEGLTSDYASGMYSSFQYLGMVISPVLGGYVHHSNHSFSRTCDAFAIGTLVFSTLYFLVNIVPSVKWGRKGK